MVTPYTWRNFVNGVPTAREGQMEPFFLQKRHFKYKLSVKKQKTGPKNGQKPQKRGIFIGTSALILQTVCTICGIPQTVRTICGIPQMVHTIYGILQTVRTVYRMKQMLLQPLLNWLLGFVRFLTFYRVMCLC